MAFVFVMVVASAFCRFTCVRCTFCHTGNLKNRIDQQQHRLIHVPVSISEIVFFSCFFFFFQWNYTKNPIQLKSSTCAVRLRVCVVTYHSFPRQHTPTWTIHPGVRTNKKDKITENRAWFGHSNRHNVQYERRIMCASFCFIEIKRIEFTERRRERG